MGISTRNILIMWALSIALACVFQVVVGNYPLQVAHEPVYHVQLVPAEREIHVSGHIGPAIVVTPFYDRHYAPVYSASPVPHHTVAPVVQHGGPHAVAPVVQHSGPHAAAVVAHPEPVVVVQDHVPAYAGASKVVHMPAVQYAPAVHHGGVEVASVNHGRVGFAAASVPAEYHHGVNLGHHGVPNHYSAPVVHKSSTPVKKTSSVHKSSKPAHSENNKYFEALHQSKDFYNVDRQSSRHGTTDNFDRWASQRRFQDDYSKEDSFNHRMNEDYHGMENHFDRSSNKHVSYESLEDDYNKKDSWSSGKDSFNHK